MNTMNGNFVWTKPARTKDVVTEGLDYDQMRRIVSDAIRRGVATPGPVYAIKQEKKASRANYPEVTRVCVICTKHFSVTSNRVTKCCSEKCTNALRKDSALRRYEPVGVCVECGSSYLKKAASARFCNRKCNRKHHKAKAKDLKAKQLPISCKQCGTMFERKAHNGIFCSDYCRKKHSSGTLKSLALSDKTKNKK